MGLRETLEAIKDEFYQGYVTPDGLALLDKGDPESDNGVLFLGFFLMLCYKAKLLDPRDTNNAFRALQSVQVVKDGQVIPGLHWRSPQMPHKMESHDNSIGVCAISAIFDFAFARQHLEYGLKTGFCYNNLEPGKFEARATRQGGDIAFIKLTAGYVPSIWETLWLAIGVTIAAFKGTPSTVNLAWLRLEALKIEKAPLGLLGPQRLILFLTDCIYNVSIKKRFGGIQGSFARYYKESHPIRRMAKELNL
jgi:hypothetical protein